MSVQNLERLLENLTINPADDRTYGDVTGSSKPLVKITATAQSGEADAFIAIRPIVATGQCIVYVTGSDGNWDTVSAS